MSGRIISADIKKKMECPRKFNKLPGLFYKHVRSEVQQNSLIRFFNLLIEFSDLIW